jgi:hypothetical protein
LHQVDGVNEVEKKDKGKKVDKGEEGNENGKKLLRDIKPWINNNVININNYESLNSVK